LTRRQGEIEEKLDLTKNQAPSQAEAVMRKKLLKLKIPSSPNTMWPSPYESTRS
jgi:hypothetical protein